jgi:hypothetical protein
VEIVFRCGGSGRARTKNKGAGSAPESRKYFGWNSLKRGYLLLTLFPLLGALLGGLLLSHVDCHLLLADLIDSPESRMLGWPPLEGREPRDFRISRLPKKPENFRRRSISKEPGVSVRTVKRLVIASPSFFLLD